MNWPWSKPEIRSSGYTDLVIAGLEARADGSTSSGRTIAALEVASGLWARSLASATVAPASAALAGLTASTLSDLGMQLCRAGEAVYTLSVEGGRVVLHPVASFFRARRLRPAHLDLPDDAIRADLHHDPAVDGCRSFAFSSKR